MNPLTQLFRGSVERHPDRPAVVDASSGQSLSYSELAAQVDAFAERLVSIGVDAGDRVGIALPKSIDSLAAVLAILACDAAYVPVDASAPPERNTWIFSDCAVAAIVDVDADGELRFSPVERADPATTTTAPADLAYILYTSGSTGKPKGVMLTHGNALSFVDWCCETFAPTEHDRFSSHAPFHFDLSILDIYVPLKHGACVVLIGEALGKNARALAPAIEEQGITVWYSTPTVLRLLTEFGALELRDLSAVRWVLFAGEVFPIKHLAALKSALPAPRYANLYGPTETNVCTWLEIPETIPADQEAPFPIGRVTSNLQGRVVDPDGKDVPPGEEGELVIAGGTVTQGYWNLPERTAEAYFVNYYRTGDLVRDLGDGVLDYIGRRDRMVKRRGYRVELGEIESGLYRFPGIAEAAAVAVPDPDSGVAVRAFIAMGQQTDDAPPPSMLKMKMFCAKVMLPYMVPDEFVFVDELPKTSTDKIDYQTLIKQSSERTDR